MQPLLNSFLYIINFSRLTLIYSSCQSKWRTIETEINILKRLISCQLRRSSESKSFWAIKESSVEQLLHNSICLIGWYVYLFPAGVRNGQLFRIFPLILKLYCDFGGLVKVNAWRSRTKFQKPLKDLLWRLSNVSPNPSMMGLFPTLDVNVG